MKKGSGREPGGGRSIAGAALILLLILLGVGAFTFHLYTRIVNESKTLAWEMTLKSAEVMELLRSLQSPCLPEEIGVDGRLLRDTLLYAKEVRPRYTLLQMGISEIGRAHV